MVYTGSEFIISTKTSIISPYLVIVVIGEFPGGIPGVSTTVVLTPPDIILGEQHPPSTHSNACQLYYWGQHPQFLCCHQIRTMPRHILSHESCHLSMLIQQQQQVVNSGSPTCHINTWLTPFLKPGRNCTVVLPFKGAEDYTHH